MTYIYIPYYNGITKTDFTIDDILEYDVGHGAATLKEAKWLDPECEYFWLKHKSTPWTIGEVVKKIGYLKND